MYQSKFYLTCLLLIVSSKLCCSPGYPKLLFTEGWGVKKEKSLTVWLQCCNCSSHHPPCGVSISGLSPWQVSSRVYWWQSIAPSHCGIFCPNNSAAKGISNIDSQLRSYFNFKNNIFNCPGPIFIDCASETKRSAQNVWEDTWTKVRRSSHTLKEEPCS